MNKKKILITGAVGFIPSNFIRKAIYEQFPYEIVGLDKITDPNALNNIYMHKDHTFYMADISDQHIVNNIFEYEKPDVVLHMAASSHVDKSLTNPNEFITNNVLGTQVVINAAVKYKVSKLIYTSTDEVYGSLLTEKDVSWTEDSYINPKNPYSASKMSGEHIIKAAHNSFELNYVITRSCNNFGPRQSVDKLIPKIIKSICSNEKIPIFGSGSNMREWIYVADNCSAIMKIIDSNIVNEIYNISANYECSNLEIVQLICNIIGKGWDNIEFIKDRAGHDFRYAINSDKIKTQLNWEPIYKFKQALSDTVQWYLKNQFWLK